MSADSQQTVLVTGGAGYIGSHVVYALLDQGHIPVVVDNLQTGIRENLPDKVPFYQTDIRDSNDIRRILRDHGCSTIMHFAGSTIVPESLEKPLEYYDNNSMASLALLTAASAENVGQFIFSSSAAVYGNPDQLPVAEDAALAPLSPYGQSKLMTEQMLRDCGWAQGLKWAALRYFNVAGADPGGRTGQSTPGATHLIKVACEVATGKRDALTIHGTDYDTADGTCIRDFIHVSDLADAHIALMDYLDDGGESMVVNCGYGKGYSVQEVLDGFKAILGRDLPSVTGPRRAGDIMSIYADNQRLRSRTDWAPRFDNLPAIIQSALAWEQTRAQTRGVTPGNAL